LIPWSLQCQWKHQTTLSRLQVPIQEKYITLQDYLDHKAMRSTLKTKREKKMLDAEFSKHSIDNTFMDDNLPLFDLFYGIFRMLPSERLHITCEGITHTCLIA